MGKCAVWNAEEKVGISEAMLKQAYLDNLWLRWVLFSFICDFFWFGSDANDRVPHTPELDRDIVEQAKQREDGLFSLPLEDLLADMQGVETRSILKKRRKSSVNEKGKGAGNPSEKGKKGKEKEE